MRFFAYVTGIGILLAASTALAFSIQQEGSYTVKWPSTLATFELDADGTTDISDGSDVAAVRRGALSWTNVSCANLVLQESGTTTATATMLTGEYADGHNRVVWAPYSQWQYGQYVLGVTAPLYNYYGNIEEADIAFNPTISWTTSDSGYGTDVESVAVHELGHFFGLQHVLGGEWCPDPPTMAPAVDPYNRTRTLSPDDASGICYLYPSSSYACAVDCDCPAVIGSDYYGGEFYTGRYQCVSSSCGSFQAGGGGSDKPLGAACNGNECASGLFCQDTGGYGSYCSQSCDPGLNNCPSGFTCYGYQNSSGGACLPDDLGYGSEGSCDGCLASVAAGGGGGSSGGGGTGPCTCDTTWSCTPGCECDPECTSSGGGGSSSGGGSSGGGGSSDGGEDRCPCDETYGCDDFCTCDPECGDGCATLAAQPGASGVGALVGVAMLLFFTRRPRRRAA